MIVERLTVEHFARLPLQESQRQHYAMMTDAVKRELVAAGSYAAVHDGVPLGIGGMIDQGWGRAQCWTMLAEGFPCKFLAVHRAALRHILRSGYRRIEMVVSPQDANGERWAKALGFQKEGVMRGWYFDGSPGFLYGRVL